MLAGFCLVALLCSLVLPPAAADDNNPGAASPDFLQGILTAIHNLISGIFPGTTGTGNHEVPVTGTVTTAAGNGPAPNGKIVAAYLYIYPGPDDDSYPLLMSVQDQIPWKKVNRLYIGFATVHDGVLADLPAGDSTEDTTRREENVRRIKNTVALCRQNNPDAEIFITSNFGREFDPEYLAAAQDPQKFADSALAYLKEYDLDGYDMDWESHRINEDASQLTALLSTCHAAFAAAGSAPDRGTRTLACTAPHRW